MHLWFLRETKYLEKLMEILINWNIVNGFTSFNFTEFSQIWIISKLIYSISKNFLTPKSLIQVSCPIWAVDFALFSLPTFPTTWFHIKTLSKSQTLFSAAPNLGSGFCPSLCQHFTQFYDVKTIWFHISILSKSHILVSNPIWAVGSALD